MNTLLRLFFGGLASELSKAFQARQNAQTEQARIAADERIAQLQAIQATRSASAGRWSVEIPCFIAGFAASGHFALVAFASSPWAPVGFVVHKLPAPMDQYQGSIILSFFGISAVSVLGKAAVSGIGLLRK